MAQRGDSVRIGSLPGIRRLPYYLAILRRMHGDDRRVISAVALAEEAGQAVSVVKKDIEMTGAVGKTGVGYEIGQLIADIERFLGWNKPSDAILVGVGNLGSALLGYDGFKRYGLRFVAAFDSDPVKIGRRVHDVEVFSLKKLSSITRRLGIITAALTVPAETAQETVDLLVDSGIASIWSFVPLVLAAPEGVTIQREDLSSGLAELMVKRRFSVRRPAPPPDE